MKTITIWRWARATFWGWILGVVLLIVLSSALDAIGVEHMQFYIGVGMGAGVGFTQWLLLRKYKPIKSAWIWASLLGMGIPFILLDLLLAETTDYKLPLGVAAGGIVTGIIQSILLKRSTQNASLWIWGSFAGWTLAALTVLAINYTMTIKAAGIGNLLMAIANLVIILAGGMVLGTVTGYTLKKAE